MKIQTAIESFLESLKLKNYSPETISTRAGALALFIKYCYRNKIENLNEIDNSFLERYMGFIFTRQGFDKKKKLLSTSRKRTLLISLKLFYRFLFQENLILQNFLEDIKIPNSNKRLPSSFLAESDIVKIIKTVDTSKYLGIRNRSILEVLYSTGIRRKELINLKVLDIDFQKEILWVRDGKNNKDRVVPIGQIALGWLKKYMSEERPRLVNNLSDKKDSVYLFLSRKRKPLSKVMLGQLVSGYRKKSGVSAEGSCHLFRHALATHMLANGADIRHIQEMLGHSSLSTTEIYTKVEINNLQSEYEKSFR